MTYRRATCILISYKSEALQARKGENMQKDYIKKYNKQNERYYIFGERFSEGRIYEGYTLRYAKQLYRKLYPETKGKRLYVID